MPLVSLKFHIILICYNINLLNCQYYAFEIVLYLILNNGEYPQISIGDVANGKIAKIPESVTSFSQGLIKKCLSFQESDRPSFDEIYQTLINNKSKIVSK